MNNQITGLGIGQEKKTLKKFENKLSKNSNVETNVPFTDRELQEHAEANPGKWKLEHELPNREFRRKKHPKSIVTREAVVEVQQSKAVRQEIALKLLKTQLEKGTKPAKMKKTMFGNWMPENPAKVSGEYIHLAADERVRIQVQINNLERKILAHKDRVSKKLVPVEMKHQPVLQDKEKVKAMRPKNPVTKLYKQIAGVYQKIVK